LTTRMGRTITEASDPSGWTAHRASLALAAQCSSMGVQQETVSVQSEVACLRQWCSKRRELYLHKDCLLEMVKNHTSKVVLLPRKTLDSFPECGNGEIPVAVRLPKDDTQEKKEKEKKGKKVLKFPKYGHFRAITTNWQVDSGAVLEVEGVCLGYKLSGPAARPLGSSPVDEGYGDPEPIEMLSVADIEDAEGAALHRGDFLRVRLREARSARWKLGSFLLRTGIEIVAVHLWMGWLGTVPNEYAAKVYQPWATVNNHAFQWPWIGKPTEWRAPGFEHIWNLFVGTLYGFILLKIGMMLIWCWLPSSGRFMKPIRYAIAALYPLAVVVPFKLYLLYHFGAITNCKQCETWHCGAYSMVDSLAVDEDAFVAAGGCNITSGRELDHFHSYVHNIPTVVPEHPHCSNLKSRMLDVFGITLDTTKTQGTCHASVEKAGRRVLNSVIFAEVDRICREDVTSRIRLEVFDVPENAKNFLPWFMFARGLPIRSNLSCSEDGVGFEDGPYIFYNPTAQRPEKLIPRPALCVCRSAHGTRDCYREVEGHVDRCSHFTGKKVQYGDFLQFDRVADLQGHFFKMFVYFVIPVFALFTTFAWDELPMGAQDKFDLRIQSRMRLDTLDTFLFYMNMLIHDNSEALPLLKFVIPDMAWRDWEMCVWCSGWMSAYLWMTLKIFLQIVDKDPDKTPKMWKSVKDILGVVDQSTNTLEVDCNVSKDPYGTALAKQSILYEKEVQKLIKKRTVVDILEDGIDPYSASPLDWRRCTIVFSSPKLKDLTRADYDRQSCRARLTASLGDAENSDCDNERLSDCAGSEDEDSADEKPDTVFTLYVAGYWLWSQKPPPEVWRAETWEEFLEHWDGPSDEVTPEDIGLTKVNLTYAEALTRVRARSGYAFLDARYLGWCHPCGWQPRFEWKKMKEDDHRILESERMEGYSETYYNKYKFDWFERNLELFGTVRSLCIDLLFLFTRVAKALWVGGFDNMLSVLLVLKNLMFSLLGIVYVLMCGNHKHRCGTFEHSPLALLAHCIERTKVGRAIKLSMLMPIRILIECLSCGLRVSTEEREEHCSKRLHMLVLQRLKASKDCEARAEMDHEIRLLAAELQDYEDLLELLDTKNIVKMRTNMKAKDILG